MSYLVLARKHRPQAFKEVAGQEHICELLSQAIASKRIAHAYLFCGPRGIGKTTCARIFAMCLNCEDGPKIDPDLNDSMCRDIAKGTSFDVLEIDGASNRGIDEIRALRENVKFAPTVGRYKIYIVDEVHMLTTEAFNALLKTLEEPPEHVKFIFATTEPNKLPATIISRCQRFDFKRIAIETIVDTLTEVSKKEKLKIDQDALYAIAKAAKGSMRDALSILDQLSALSKKGISAEDVFSMLGLVETQYLFDIVDALSRKECIQALETLDKIINQGKDIKQLICDLIEHYRHLMVIKIGGKSMGKLVDYPIAIKEMLLVQTEPFRLSEILNSIELLLQAQDAARVAESYRLALEVCFAQLTFDQNVSEESEATVATPLHQQTDKPKQSAPSTPVKEEESKPSLDKSVGQKLQAKQVEQPQVLVQEEPPAQTQPKLESVHLNLVQIRQSWDMLTSAVSREKMSIATYLQDGSPMDVDGQTLIVGFPHNCAFQKEVLEEMANIQLVERTFEEKLQVNLSVRYTLTANPAPKTEDFSVQTTLDEFGGKVTNRWHNES